MELHTGWRTATERDGSFESGPSARSWSVNIVDNGPLWFAKWASPDRMIQRYWRVALIVVTDVPELVGLLPVA
jgi:hypothetical protein